MDKVDIASADLNLLVALRALIRTRHITRAAESVGITQPAMSRSLNRLRALFGDPLLVRGKHGYELTARAEGLAYRLETCLGGIEEILAPEGFDPATAQGTVNFCTTDFGALFYIPYLAEMLHSLAPHLDVGVKNWDGNALQLIEDGEVDVGLGIMEESPAHIRLRRMGTDRLVCVVREDHPILRQSLTLSRYCDLDHVDVPSYLSAVHDIDRNLARLNLRRRIAVQLPYFVSAVNTVSQADFITTLPKMFAETLRDTMGLKVALLPLPLDLPPIHYSILWHERVHHDPAHRWLRNMMVTGFGQRFTGMVKVFENVVDLPGWRRPGLDTEQDD
ncbi:MAG: LysR family transcriptional regulator [Spongiibacteraceae bacterium]|jgi:DNA-binding transcriptional LysR family regulator|nr:LysR family transcriptional regulator [Spongiibacteraceae bacterium]